MKTTRYIILLVIIGMATALAGAQEQLPTLNKFPATTTANILGEEISIPESFASDWNVVVFSFWEKHRAAANDWGFYIEQYLIAEGINATYYNIILTHTYSPRKQQTTTAEMIETVPPDVHDRTLVLYQNRFKFIREYGIDQQFGPYVLLVAPDGTTRTIAQGTFTEERKQAFLDSLVAAGLL